MGTACAGYLPGQWAVTAQWWWWLAASGIVLAVGLSGWRVLQVREPGWGLLALVVVAAGWAWRMPGAVGWLLSVGSLLLAGQVLVERWGWTPLRRAVVWWAWAQVALLPAAWMGIAPYHEGWTGTMGHRSVLAVWLGMASLWSSRWRAVGLALASLLTGSLSGLIALVRLLPLRWKHPLVGVALMGLGLATWQVWGPRLALRWSVWREALGWWSTHGVTGWGLQVLPGGFREAKAARLATSFDLHNTWLEALVRGGGIGLLLLLSVMGWAWWRSVKTNTNCRSPTCVVCVSRPSTTCWTWGFVAFVMSWQSLSAQPALLCLSLVWLLSLCEPRRVTLI